MNQLVPISSPTLPALVAAVSERVSPAAREGRQAPRGRAITTSEEYLIGYLDGPSGTGNASGANHFQSQISKRHIGGIKRMPTKNGPGTGLGERFRGAGSGSHSTLRWREIDSNFQFRAK
jgi:hypothetical protein